MVAIAAPTPHIKAQNISTVTADEAYSLMITALDRFLALVDDLDPDNWDKPTYCAEWSNRDIVAHQVGGYASGTCYKEMLRHASRLPARGQLIEDAINEFSLKSARIKPQQN